MPFKIAAAKILAKGVAHLIQGGSVHGWGFTFPDMTHCALFEVLVGTY